MNDIYNLIQATLHSNMFLLILKYALHGNAALTALHSNMFLLILEADEELTAAQAALHSNMFLLIRGRRHD